MALLLQGLLAWISFAGAAVLLCAALLAPRWLNRPAKHWIRLGEMLHGLISPMVLALIFFGVVAPISVVMRLLGKRPLGLRFDRAAKSYWTQRAPPGPRPSSLHDQF